MNRRFTINQLGIKLANRRFSWLAILGFFLAGIAIVVVSRDTFRLLIFSDRGFDFGDEGFYIASYATRNRLGRSFTGATFIIGPIFELLGSNVITIRIFKVFSLVATGAFAGYQTFEFIATRIKAKAIISLNSFDLMGFRIAMIGASILAMFYTYTWTPASPSYNDLNAVALILTLSIILRLYRKNENSSSSWFSFAMLGLLNFVLVFNKPSTGILITPFIVTTVFIYWVRKPRRILIPAAYVFGALGTLAVLALLAGTFRIYPDSYGLLSVIRMEVYDPSDLALGYWRQLLSVLNYLVETSWAVYFWGIVVAALSIRLKKKYAWIAAFCLWIPFAIHFTNYRYMTGRQLFEESRSFSFAILVAALLALLAGTISKNFAHPNRFKEFSVKSILLKVKDYNVKLILIFALLFLIPFIQAAGSDAHILTGSTFSQISWFLLIVTLAFSSKDMPTIKIALVLFALLLVAGIRMQTVDGFFDKPYGIDRPKSAMITKSKLSPISNLKLVPRRAQYLDRLLSARNEYGFGPGETILAFGVPGEVYALEGYSPGEPWLIKFLPIRNSRNIDYACKTGDIGSKNPPLILANRSIPEETPSLVNCGINFPDGYERIAHVRYLDYGVYTDFYAPKSLLKQK